MRRCHTMRGLSTIILAAFCIPAVSHRALATMLTLAPNSRPMTMCYIKVDSQIFCGQDGADARSISKKGGHLSLSADGKKLLYWNYAHGAKPLILHDLSTGAEREVAHAYDPSGVISPDGQTIAFVKTWRQPLVSTIPADDRGEPATIQGPKIKVIQQWSPDGKALLVSNLDSLMWLSPQGERIRSIPLKSIYGNTYVAYADDNSFRMNPVNPNQLVAGAAFEQAPPGAQRDSLKTASAIFTYDVSSREVRPLIPPSIYGKEPAWTPDGSEVYFSRLNKDRRGTWSIWKVNKDGSGLQYIAEGLGVVLAR